MTNLTLIDVITGLVTQVKTTSPKDICRSFLTALLYVASLIAQLILPKTNITKLALAVSINYYKILTQVAYYRLLFKKVIPFPRVHL